MSGQIEIPFAVGTEVWWCGPQYEEKYEPCPDCAGNKRVHLVLGCGDVVVLACPTCSVGYDPPRGVVKKTVCGYAPRRVKLEAVEIYHGEVRYSGGGYCLDLANLFEDVNACGARCEELRAEAQAQEDRMFDARHKSRRRDATTSARYWREQVKRLEEELARARARLEAKK